MSDCSETPEGTYRILCVEDSPHDLALIRHALEHAAEARFEVTVATDREAFEQQLSGASFDLVLTDFNILGFEGLDVIAAVRRVQPGVPVVVVTGTGSEEVAVAALKAGADDYVIKTAAHIARLPHTVCRVLEARQVRDRLSRRAEDIRVLVDNIDEGVLVVGGDGRIRFANPAAGRLLGEPPEALEGTLFGHPVPPAGEAAEVDLPRRAGGAGTALLRVSETFWRGERCALLLLQDVTAQRRMEEQLRQSQKLEAVGTLAAGVAHDFNNLLTAVLGIADLALGQLDPASPLAEDLAEIKRVAVRGAQITRRLLAFSRKDIRRPERLEVNAALRDLARMLRHLVPEDIALNLSLAADVTPIWMDPGQFEQVVMNLVVNARDAMPEGGTLTLETARVRLDEAYFAAHGVRPDPGEYVMVAVTDTGVGMDAATRERIFEPFFTTKTRESGTGLGMATVFGIVKQNLGYVWVYSELGQGTTVKVYLPPVDRAAGAQAGADAGDDPGAGASAPKLTVLVAEDNDGVRAVACRALRRLGHEVLEARSGEEALAVAQAYPGPIALLVTDVVMPGMNGRELADRLRAERPGLRVLFTSGYTENAIQTRGVLSADVAFLSKPFTPADLQDAIRAVFARDAD